MASVFGKHLESTWLITGLTSFYYPEKILKAVLDFRHQDLKCSYIYLIPIDDNLFLSLKDQLWGQKLWNIGHSHLCYWYFPFILHFHFLKPNAMQVIIHVTIMYPTFEWVATFEKVRKSKSPNENAEKN